MSKLHDVFDTEKRPWIQPDNASADEIADVVRMCPSGALQYESQSESIPNEAPDTVNTIQVINDGPLYVRGDLQLKTADGVESETRLALCRCGQSENKPYCDNSHKKIDFYAEPTGEAIEPTLEASGQLTIEPYDNGPVGIRGEYRILNQEGEIIQEGEKTAVCRCGNSGNKPICDGTHRKIGFES